MWLFSITTPFLPDLHHGSFTGGRIWKPLCARGMLCGGLGLDTETDALCGRRLLLGEQLFDAQLSVRFSSFNTLSFFKT